MTEPQQFEIPKSPTIEKLRAAIEAAEWVPLNEAAMAIADFRADHASLLDAARAVVAEHDAQIAAVKLMMSMPRPTAEQIREQFVAAGYAAKAAGKSVDDLTLRHNDGTPIYVDMRVEGGGGT